MNEVLKRLAALFHPEHAYMAEHTVATLHAADGEIEVRTIDGRTESRWVLRGPWGTH